MALKTWGHFTPPRYSTGEHITQDLQTVMIVKLYSCLPDTIHSGNHFHFLFSCFSVQK